MKSHGFLAFAQFPAEFGYRPKDRPVRGELDERMFWASGFEAWLLRPDDRSLRPQYKAIDRCFKCDLLFKNAVPSIDDNLAARPDIKVSPGAEQDLDRIHILAWTLALPADRPDVFTRFIIRLDTPVSPVTNI